MLTAFKIQRSITVNIPYFKTELKFYVPSSHNSMVIFQQKVNQINNSLTLGVLHKTVNAASFLMKIPFQSRPR